MAFHKNKSHHAGRLSDGSVNNARMASRKNKPERTGFPSDKYIKRYSRSAHVLALISTILLVLSAVLFSIEYIQTTRQYNSQRAGKVSSASVTERKRPGMVLFLASYGPSQKLFADEQEGIAGVFDESNITCETVCMNHKAFGTEQDDAAFRSLMEERMESYQDRYAGIVTADDAALKFVLDNRETMFKDIPVVYFGVSNKDLAARASSDPYIEGYTEDLGIKETIAVAQKLIPQAVRVTAVCDNTITSEANKGIFNDLSDQFPGLDFELFNFEEHTIDETTEYLSGLGDDTILLDLDAYYDRDGNYYAVDQSVAIISKAAKIPVFRAAIDGFEEGCTAGVHTDALKASVLAAQQLVGYLNGETGLDDHSVPLSADLLEYTYNDEAMRHFGLDTSVFPADTEVVNRRENFWSDYRAILIPAILAILGMAAAFLGLRQGAKISRFRAQHDALTGLYNRHTALSKLAGYSDSGKKRAIILTDIDNFKIFNETYGHSNGDRLMEEIASLLLHYCEKHGLGCCRYGGDEFLVFVKDRGLEGEDDRLIRDIFDLFKQPILLGADLVVPSASIGAANVRPGKTAEDAVLDADIALTRAKAAGKNICMFYTEDMRKSVEGITKTKNSIVSAVQNDGFYMVYQPKVDVATGNVIG
jgi:diguanylate cyclase (GGDEF)-like protein